MIITNKALPRRTFLRGAGVALALPLLDAMIPVFSKASGAANPVSFALESIATCWLSCARRLN